MSFWFPSYKYVQKILQCILIKRIYRLMPAYVLLMIESNNDNHRYFEIHYVIISSNRNSNSTQVFRTCQFNVLDYIQDPKLQ